MHAPQIVSLCSTPCYAYNGFDMTTLCYEVWASGKANGHSRCQIGPDCANCDTYVIIVHATSYQAYPPIERGTQFRIRKIKGSFPTCTWHLRLQPRHGSIDVACDCHAFDLAVSSTPSEITHNKSSFDFRNRECNELSRGVAWGPVKHNKITIWEPKMYCCCTFTTPKASL